MAAVGRGWGLAGEPVDRQKALCQRKEKPRSLPEVEHSAQEAQGKPERGSAGLPHGRKLPLSRTRWQFRSLAELGN